MLVLVCYILLINEPRLSVALALLSKSTLINLALGFSPSRVHIHAYNTGIAGFSDCLQVEDARRLFNIASNNLQFLKLFIVSLPHTSCHLCSDSEAGS